MPSYLAQGIAVQSERIVYREVPVEKIIEKPVEIVKIVEKVVEKVVEVPIETVMTSLLLIRYLTISL